MRLELGSVSARLWVVALIPCYGRYEERKQTVCDILCGSRIQEYIYTIERYNKGHEIDDGLFLTLAILSNLVVEFKYENSSFQL